MSDSPYLTTREVAAILHVHEKQVYVLIKEGSIPCTRATGKWLFPRALIDRWLVASCARRATTAGTPEPRTLIIAGSDDLLLGAVGQLVREQVPGLILAWCCLGSVGGLHAVRSGGAHVAGCHLDVESVSNRPRPARSKQPLDGTRSYVRRILAGQGTVAVTFAERRQGWIMAPGNPKSIGAVDDLTRRDVRIINRQEGSGTRLLLDRWLHDAGIDRRHIRGRRREVLTHLEVAMAVARGDADVGLGTEAAAAALGLDFLPLHKERYQLIMPRSTYELPTVQAFLDLLQGAAFRRLARRFPGYSVRHAGSLSWDDSDAA